MSVWDKHQSERSIRGGSGPIRGLQSDLAHVHQTGEDGVRSEAEEGGGQGEEGGEQAGPGRDVGQQQVVDVHPALGGHHLKIFQ